MPSKHAQKHLTYHFIWINTGGAEGGNYQSNFKRTRETISVLPTENTETSSITKNPTQEHKKRYLRDHVPHQYAQQLKLCPSSHEKLSSQVTPQTSHCMQKLILHPTINVRVKATKVEMTFMITFPSSIHTTGTRSLTQLMASSVWFGFLWHSIVSLFCLVCVQNSTSIWLPPKYFWCVTGETTGITDPLKYRQRIFSIVMSWLSLPSVNHA
jgi:hypothetical protein